MLSFFPPSGRPPSCLVGKSVFGTKGLEEIQIIEELRENKYCILIQN